MRISYNWLKEYVSMDGCHKEIAEKLTDAGVVVEHIYKPFRSLEGVLVVEIKEISSHPDADKLSITEVSDGKETYQIVCGADNIEVGQKVPLATVGTVLPGNFKIKKSKIRGIESFGMLCSAQELKLDIAAEDGILILPSQTQIGTTIEEALELKDFIFELDLTPNRGDCLSMLGVAKEIAAITGANFKKPSQLEDKKEVKDLEVILQTNNCRSYVAQAFDNIIVKPSPIWLQIRLLKAGVRPINNIVDISNYVMLETGQPLHCFDQEAISTSKIVVKEAGEDFKLATLDNEQRDVGSGTLLITDSEKALAIAGVIGGLDSEVKDYSNKVVLESAYFDPTLVRRSAKQLGVKTDASARFEKGVDPQRVQFAANRATKLLAEICGATPQGRILTGDFSVAQHTIKVDVAEINAKLGLNLTCQEIVDIFKRLECQVEGDEDLTVTPPTYRVDLQQPVDLVEEVARIFGYNKIPTSLPSMETTVGAKDIGSKLVDKIKDTLAGLGVFETMTYPFISKEDYRKTNMEWESSIKIANPLSENESLMRTSMLPSILSSVLHNQKHSIEGIEIFEVGKVYQAKTVPLKEHPKEDNILAIAISSETNYQHWYKGKSIKKDFYHAKGILEDLFSSLNIVKWKLAPASSYSYHPNKSGDIIVDGDILGTIGEIHPEISDNWGVKGEVIIIELNLSKLVSYWDDTITYQGLAKHPAVYRDLAVIVDEEVKVGDMMDDLQNTNIKFITGSDVFDVYQGDNIESGKKSIALSLTIQADRTLKEKEINKTVKQVMNLLEKKYSAKLR
ncbi:phenylalanine--tRNA ligase subunit beta [Proteinivorax tanatarense]|uniref:Phenylalanine--tRNA ligase beta subunit n=1 Tax=Proteinivorax tanatarense TaxID=1260629 RepID=A0AAU7VNL1_9FIRM